MAKQSKNTRPAECRLSCRRVGRFVGICGLFSIAASAGAVAFSAPVARSKSLTVTKFEKTRLGTVLVTTKGYALYRYTPDTAKKVTCTGECATIWPPLVLPVGVTRPTGVSGLGTIRDPNGRLQVTYRGHPLYRYAGDHVAGATNGEGVEHTWYVVSPSVAVLRELSTTSANSDSSTKGTPGANPAPTVATPTTVASNPGASTTTPSSVTTSPPATPTTVPKPVTTTVPPASSGGYGY